MANRTVSVNLVANIGQYVSGMNTAAGATLRLGESATASTKKAQSGFDMAGKGALVMGAAVVGGMAMAVSKSMEFEKAMSAVGAATQATGATLSDLRDAAMKAGAATQYSATEAADAITEMAKAGVSAKDIMGGGLTGALNLAAAGQMNVADAAGTAATAMVQFGLSGKDLPHVADLLAAGAGKAMGSVSDLSNALKYVGPVAAGMGVSIEETTGTLALFASQGILSEQAGTSLRGMLSALTSPSKIAAGTMEDLGIQVFDAQGKFIGLDGIAGQLHDSMSGLTEAERSEALGRIFGNEQVTAARILYKDGAKAVQDWTAKVNDSGFAQEQAAKLTDNLAGDLERLGGSFDTLLISMGSGAQGPLRDLVQGLTDLLDAIGGDKEAFDSLPAPVRLALDAFSGLFDVVGGLVDAFGAMSGPMQMATVAALGWAVAGDRIMGVLGPMGGALGPMRGAWSAFGESLDYARANGDGLGTVLRSVGDYAGGRTLTAIKNLGRAIGPELGVAAGVFVVTSLIDGFQNLAGASDEAKAAAEGLAKALTLTDEVADRKTVRSLIEDTDGLVEALERAGVSSKDAVNGLLGQEGAQRRVTSALQDYINVRPGGIHNQEATDALNAKHAYDELAGGYGTAASNARFFADAAGGAAGATDTSGAAAGAAAPQVDEFATAAASAKDQMDAAKDAVDAFKLSLDILTGANVSMIQVESAFEAAVAAADGALKNMHGTVLNATGGLNMQSESGRAAADVLLDVRDSGNQLISTMIQQGATGDQVRAKDAQLRESFIQSAIQMGINRQAAEVLANQILGIPDRRNTQITADIGQATGAVQTVQTAIDNLRGRTVQIRVETSGTGAFSGNTRIMTPGFATGGYTGPGAKYQPAGVVHAGEVVFSQDDVRAHGGVAAVESLRRSRRGYAEGGPVAPLSVRAELNTEPYNSSINAMAAKVAKDLEPVTGMIGALQFARAQVGKPYIWGGVGPAGYDCSGFMSAITNVIRGRSPYSRVGSTASFPWGGFTPGYGAFTIGSTPNAGGGIGHMAGTLLGVNVESTGNHVRVGGDARGASNGLFSQRSHLVFGNGGVIGEPVSGIGHRSGRSYTFGERGPETVIPGLPTSREFSGGGGSGTVVRVAAPDLKGLTIQGRVTIDGNGIATIAGQIVDQAIDNMTSGLASAGVRP